MGGIFGGFRGKNKIADESLDIAKALGLNSDKLDAILLSLAQAAASSSDVEFKSGSDAEFKSWCLSVAKAITTDELIWMTYHLSTVITSASLWRQINGDIDKNITKVKDKSQTLLLIAIKEYKDRITPKEDDDEQEE
jgi:hypothetical protein